MFRKYITAATLLLSFMTAYAADVNQGNRSQDSQKKLVLDLVNSAVAVRPSDPQDRLRILISAATTVRSVSPELASKLADEGVQLEGQMIRTGVKPEQSMFDTGLATCKFSAELLQSVPPQLVFSAEQQIIGLITTCRDSRTLSAAQQKLQAAGEDNVIAPRAVMSAIDATGPASDWSKRIFAQTFSNLRAASGLETEADAVGEIYSQFAPSMPRELVVSSGLQALEWLANIKEGAKRTVAINMITDAMHQALGDEKYKAALASDGAASQAAQLSGQAIPDDNIEDGQQVSAMQIMSTGAKPDTSSLAKLPPARRAREFAAYGFAAASGGDASGASEDFDQAFDALQDLWNSDSSNSDAVPVLDEVVQAAAHINVVQTLSRAQALPDPTAQALAMLTVAQVVQAGP